MSHQNKSKTLSDLSTWTLTLILIATTFSKSIYAQDDVTGEIARIVYLDSIVVSASKDKFSVNDFIDLVREDASFYLAFRNLRAAAYDFDTEMFFLNRRDHQVASYHAKHRQYFENDCRYQVLLMENVTGNFYKKRKQEENFYTYSLYDRLFLTHDTLCGVVVVPQELSFEGRGMEGHVGELKKLIFAPGTRSDVPLIGDKTEIFSENMRDKYDFFIRSSPYTDSIDAYVFEARLKSEYTAPKNNKTVIKELITYFAKDDFQVLARSYRLAHYKTLYSFDIEMEITLSKIAGRYFPVKIHYAGFWNVPTKKKEPSSFTITFNSFKP